MLRLKRSDYLTETAKNIFGDIVVSARVAVDTFGNPFDSYYENELKKAALSFDKAEDVIRYDTLTIVIEFNNDRMVRFSNSEWALIEEFKPELNFDKPKQKPVPVVKVVEPTSTVKSETERLRNINV